MIMRKSCFNCKYLYAAGNNVFVCGKKGDDNKDISSTPIYMELLDALDTVCSDHKDRIINHDDKTSDMVFYR